MRYNVAESQNRNFEWSATENRKMATFATVRETGWKVDIIQFPYLNCLKVRTEVLNYCSEARLDEESTVSTFLRKLKSLRSKNCYSDINSFGKIIQRHCI
jgi:hypothetical protein